MKNRIRNLIAAMLLAVTVLGTGAAPVTAKGLTPFNVRARMLCDGRIAWWAEMGDEPTQIVWVKVDFVTTIAFKLAPTAGTYFALRAWFNPRVPHILVFRRVVEAKVQEQAIVVTAACLR